MKIKITVFCPKCGLPSTTNGRGIVNTIVELNDRNFYTVTCQDGHSANFRLQQEKFELLFDQGAMALLDGYSRESVASFASSLERFIEYFLKTVCFNKNLPFNDFEKAWKSISKQSERQNGAFYFIQLLEWGQLLFPLDEKKVSFRNQVIHQGYIPTKEDAIAFGDYVLQYIFSCIKELNKTCKDNMLLSSFYVFMNSKDKMEDISTATQCSIPTIISLNACRSQNYGQLTLIEALKSLDTNKFYKDFYRKNDATSE